MLARCLKNREILQSYQGKTKMLISLRESTSKDYQFPQPACDTKRKRSKARNHKALRGRHVDISTSLSLERPVCNTRTRLCTLSTKSHPQVLLAKLCVYERFTNEKTFNSCLTDPAP